MAGAFNSTGDKTVQSSTPAFKWDCSDNNLVVDSSKSSPNERPDPKYPLVSPSMVSVVDDSSSETPGRVDASTSDGNGGHVN